MDVWKRLPHYPQCKFSTLKGPAEILSTLSAIVLPGNGYLVLTGRFRVFEDINFSALKCFKINDRFKLKRMATTNIDWVKENQTKFDTNLKGNLCLRNYWKVTGYVVLIDRGTKGQKMRCPCQAQESGTKRGKTLSPCQTREWHKGRENALTPIKAELSGQPKKSPNDNRSSKIFWRLIIKVL